MGVQLRDIGASVSSVPQEKFGLDLSALIGVEPVTIKTILMTSLVIWLVYMVVTVTITINSGKSGW